MDEVSDSKAKRGAKADRARTDRLGAALRANLKRRKSQARAKGGEGEVEPVATPEPREDTVPE